jgi:uncharacterized protein
MTTSPESKRIAVLGATPRTDRYAFLAMQRLKEHGYQPIPVNPGFAEVLGEKCYPTLAAVPPPIDTVTMYVGAARSTPLIPEILDAKPRRIVFNPGAENPALANAARQAGIEVVEGCTLVMLGRGTF